MSDTEHNADFVALSLSDLGYTENPYTEKETDKNLGEPESFDAWLEYLACG